MIRYIVTYWFLAGIILSGMLTPGCATTQVVEESPKTSSKVSSKENVIAVIDPRLPLTRRCEEVEAVKWAYGFDYWICEDN